MIATSIGLAATLVLVAGVTIVNKIETGRWGVPTAGDVVRMVKGRPRDASKTIFLERQPIALRPGVDDAPHGISSVLANARGKPVKLPGWQSTEERWGKLVACVRERFAPFDVQITDERPLHADFVLVAVGGTPKQAGLGDQRVGGIAPYTGEVIPVPVVFAFAAALDHDVRAVCDTIAKQVAHVYGQRRGADLRELVSVLGSRSRP